MCGLVDQLSVSEDELSSVKYLVNEKVLKHENVQEYYNIPNISFS
jgi:hypothetical protein